MHTAPPDNTTLYTLVPHLLNLYPDWEEWDIAEFLEEKTSQRVNGEDLQTIKTLCLRDKIQKLAFGA